MTKFSRFFIIWISICSVLGVFSSYKAQAVTLPFTHSSGTPIRASEVNANEGALRDAVNAHEALSNGHNTSLFDAMSVSNSMVSLDLNFNFNEALNMRIENVSSDPTCSASSKGKMIVNTVSNLLKYCDGSSYISIAGTGVNTLASVLSAGNTASTNINMAGFQLLSSRVENLVADPAPGSVGRLFFNTTGTALKVDTGSAIVAIGGSQGLSSVLAIDNSAGANDIDFNLREALQIVAQKLAGDPGGAVEGQFYYNTVAKVLKYYDGASWLEIGNTNTLSEVLTQGNTANMDLDFAAFEAKNMRLDRVTGQLNTAQEGRVSYDNVSEQAQFESSARSEIIATLAQTQTLTNKTIDGGSNTLQNIPDSALSANVQLLNGVQTVSGKKTFSTAPQMARILGGAAGTVGHLIPDLVDDTFVLLNASQTLASKTFSGASFTGTTLFNNFEAQSFVIENLLNEPAFGNPGRLLYKSSTSEILFDNGVEWRVIGAGVLGGEINTASNIGAAGVGVFDSKLGVDLRFRNINAGSSKITVTDDGANDEIDIDVAEANLSLANFGGLLDLTSQVTGTLPFGNGGTGLAALGTGLQQLRVNAGATALEYFTLTFPNQVAGADTEIQVNNGGVFGSEAAYTYDFGTNTQTVDNITLGGTIDGRDPSVDGTKLDGISAGAEVNQSDAGIKTQYENNADTNAFTDAEQTKLTGIATGAEVNPALISQAEAEGGTDTNERLISGLRLKQSIDALSGGSSSTTILRFMNHAGYGSVDTKIPYFTTTVVNSPGSDMTITSNDATNGLQITINTAGVYAITFNFSFDAATGIFGISLNATGSTAFPSLTQTERLVEGNATVNDSNTAVTISLPLSVNDVIKPHVSSASSANSRTGFIIARVD